MTTLVTSQEIKQILINEVKSEKLKFGTDTRNRIIKVIHGYGKREGFFNKIDGVFYRIWNAVKAIIGKSDWQLASKAMKKEMLPLKKIPKDLKRPLKDLKEKKLKLHHDFILTIINQMLNCYVKSTYIKEKSPKKVSEEHRKLLSNTIKKPTELLLKKKHELNEEFKKRNNPQSESL